MAARTIDIGPRVQAELDKNGGVPSPDPSVTDFSDATGAVVGPDDIDAIADQLEDGAWIIVNQEWAQFYFDGGADWGESVYLNGFNHPGLNHAAVDRLAAIIDERGLKLGGIGADNLAIDTGEGNVGEGPNMDTDVWYSHTVLFQRGVLILENMSNLDELAMAMNAGAECQLVVGAPRTVRGTGGPSRVFAMCEN